MRIAIVSPYSWTYAGGVNRHVEALADELIERDNEVRVLAPYDPPDRLSRVSRLRFADCPLEFRKLREELHVVLTSNRTAPSVMKIMAMADAARICGLESSSAAKRRERRFWKKHLEKTLDECAPDEAGRSGDEIKLISHMLVWKLLDAFRSNTDLGGQRSQVVANP